MKRRAHSLFRGISRTSRNIIKLCFLCVFSLSSLMIQAQDNQRISVDLREETLESVLWYLQNRTKFIFMYATEDIANITDISVRAKDKTITEILNECLEGTNLTYEISGSAIVIKKRKTDKITISGWIRDTSGEALPGATVSVRGSKQGAIAGLDGHYTFSISGTGRTNIDLFVHRNGKENSQIYRKENHQRHSKQFLKYRNRRSSGNRLSEHPAT